MLAMPTALAAVFVALLACAQPAAGGNLADVLSGEWVVSRWSANEFERSVAAEGERRQRMVEEHDAAQQRKKAGGGEDEGEGDDAATTEETRPVVVTGLLATNATATDGVLGGTLMLDSGYEVKVEAPRIKKAAVVTLTLPDEDAASLTFTLKPQPVGAHGVSLSRYTTKDGATGTAAAHFHSAGSIYVTLVPAEGSKGASQSFWLVRLAEEGSFWDNWYVFILGGIGFVTVRVLSMVAFGELSLSSPTMTALARFLKNPFASQGSQRPGTKRRANNARPGKR